LTAHKRFGNKLTRRIARFLFVMLVLHFIVEASGHHYLYNTLANTVFKGRLGPGIEEYKGMPNRTVFAGNPEPWPTSTQFGNHSLSAEEEAYHQDFASVSFVVIHRDSLLFEKYWENFGSDSISNSFSMAKSIVGVLTGIAIEKGLIKSVNQPVNEFLPQYGEGLGRTLTIKHLLTMSAGINFDENYINPFAFPAKANYGDNLELLLTNYEVVDAPGKYFDYQSGATQILSEIVAKAGKDQLANLATDWLWKEIGAEHEALWSLDREDGEEKAFCCFNATAKDFARVGKLYKDFGNWNGKQLLDTSYVYEATTYTNLLETDGTPCKRYSYSWWLGEHKGMSFFFMRGIKGQYVMVVPEKDLILVRMGRKRDNGKNWPHPDDVFNYLDMALKMIEE
jgi:CubicO group peptidase (beta-lactamase class C family)